jgi:uncharacterized protein YjdB
LNIVEGASVIITGRTDASIKVACEEGVTLTLNIARINASAIDMACALSFYGSGNKLIVNGNNNISSGWYAPGIRVEGDTELEITGGGVLNVHGGSHGAGIGGGNGRNGGKITISDGFSGYINAYGGGGNATVDGDDGAGIGGGSGGDGGTINIAGGDVEAIGGGVDNPGAAGIGGGSNGDGGNITISGGDVRAVSGIRGAGIGGGSNGIGGNILITGGTVSGQATGDRGAYVDGEYICHSGAGIGGGYGGDGGTILIEGGTVSGVATGYSSGAGIGGGKYGNGGDITISGGTVTAGSFLGESKGAGIGGGEQGSGGNITISGGTIKILHQTTARGAGIGGGRDGSGGNIKILGDAQITTMGGDGSAGIGGGYRGNGGTIDISGGIVYASSGSEDAYDIGPGELGNNGTIEISGSAAVFLETDSISPSPTTTLHKHITFTEDVEEVIGISIPAGWEPTFGAYLLARYLTYDANGGVNAPAKVIVKLDDSTEVSDDTGMSYTGYEFVRWNNQSDGNGTSYDPGDSIFIDGDKTLFAIWKVIEADNVDITSDTEVLLPYDKMTLTAVVSPDTALDKSVSWSCDDENVATVESNGVVTAVSTGTATIKAETKNGFFDTCEIVVTGILLNYKLSTDSVMEISATARPGGTALVWTSDNENVATVDNNGTVTAISPGYAIIIAKVDGVLHRFGISVYDQAVTSVVVSSDSADLTVGGTIKLTAYVAPEDAANKDVTWSSSDTDVAIVETDGEVTAVGAGEATITAASGSFSDTCVVTVLQPVTSVDIDADALTLAVSGTAKLNASLLPANAQSAPIYWSSNDRKVASVDSTGLVTAIGAGTATITATANGKTDTCTVTVSEKDVSSVSLDTTTKSLYVGDWFTLSATISPSDASDKSVSWTSSDTSVATVTSNGTVEAVGNGSCDITATADGKSASCTVTVTEKPASSVTLDTTSKSLYIGDWFTLSATVSPSDASDKSVTWNSSDTSVATVTTNGTVEAVGDGACTITATAGGKSASCSVSVGTKAVTSISLDYSSQSLYVGGVFALTATVKPNDAADPSITWSSSNTSVATVNSSGVVTAQGVGSCKITAQAGTKIDSCSVTVKPDPEIKVESVNLSIGMDTVMVMYVGDTSVLNANVSPSNADNKSVTWQSSDSSVATVIATGKVTAVAAGEATIRVTASDKSNSYRVLVKEREQASAETGGEEPPATTTQATQQNSQPSPSPEAEVVLSFNIDTASLPYGAQYIELPNGEIVEVNGKDTVTCDICSKDLINGTIKIVALDAEKNPLGVVDVSAEKGGLSGVMILLIAIGAVILGAGGMLLVVRAAAVKK